MIKIKNETIIKTKPKRKVKFCIFFFIQYTIIASNLINFHKFPINKRFQRIFLCSLYNNEAEMAYVHLWRLYDYVDKFIIIVSNISHAGHTKNITFEPFEHDIEKFKNKVDIVTFDNICNMKEYYSQNYNWCIEMSQRDFAKTFIEQKYNPTRLDLLIVVDIDEILTREGIEYIRKNPPRHFYFLKGSLYFPYYYHRLEDWDRGFIVRYHKKMKTLSEYRSMKITKKNIITFEYNSKKPLITHCSYCFKDIETYKNKLKSFAHSEFNAPPYTSNDWIFKSNYCRIKINSPISEYDELYEGWQHLIPDNENLKYLIDRSFMYSLNQTSYNIKDLENLCNVSYNRTPFEDNAKYNPKLLFI